MKLSFTQRVLGNAKPALENDEMTDVVDQNAIAEQPAEEIPTDTVETPAEDLPEEAGAEEIPAEEPVTELEVDGDLPQEQSATVVEETEAPVDGIEPVEPPAVIPVSETGEVTVDQVEAIAEGDPEAAATAVAEAETEEGNPTTPEEVLETAEEVEAEAPADDDGAVETNDITPEGEVPSSDEIVSDVDAPIEDTLAPVSEDEPTSDLPETEETPSEEPSGDAPVETATEDCACEDQGTNPPVESSEGKGEQELPPESVAVDEANGEENRPAQDQVVDSEKGEETKPTQEVEVDSDKGEETLPPQDTAVDESAGSNVHSGEIVSTESEEIPETVVVDGPEEEILTATDGVVEDGEEDPIVEIEVAPYVDDCQEEEEILNEALTVYPQVADVLRNAVDNGGVSVEAMAILNIFTARDGIPLKSDVSLESYNYTARTQTKLAIEAIELDMKGWLAKLIDLIKRGYENVKGFLKSRFDQMGILRRRAESLKDLDLGVPGGVEIEGDFSAIQVEGKIPANWSSELNDFINQFKAISKFGDRAISGAESIMGMVKKDILDVMVKDNEQSVDVKAIYDKSEEVFKGIVKDSFFKPENNEGFPSYLSPELMGDIQLQFLFGAEGGSGAWHEPTFKVNKLDFEPCKSAPSLDGKAIHAAAFNALSILDVVDENKAEGAYETAFNDAISELERISRLNLNTNNSHRDELHAVSKMLSGANRFATGTLSVVTGLAVKVAQGVIQYAEASAKAKQA